jgi:hypothetical protein
MTFDTYGKLIYSAKESVLGPSTDMLRVFSSKLFCAAELWCNCAKSRLSVATAVSASHDHTSEGVGLGGRSAGG